ncbi:MAG: response regulator, partial [Hydrogenophaga sp.]|nr:response regulator [Hydrogenophaga sp.]
LLGMAESLLALQQNNTARALDDVRRLANDALSPDFDFETACNLLALMSRLQMRSISLNESEGAVDTLALRFCTSKAMSELMACAASGVQGFSDRVRSAHSQILKMTEQAMTLSIKGDPQGTVIKLLDDGERTLNAKLIESAHQVLQRYNVRIAEFTALNERTEALRERYRTTAQHSRLGEHTGATATPGGVSLPAGYKPPSADGLLNT